MEDNNPYQSPSSDLEPDYRRPGELRPVPRRLASSYGWYWLQKGFDSFSLSSAGWIGAVLLMVATSLVTNLIPLVGALIWAVINYVIKGGFMLGAKDQSVGRPFLASHAFSAFNNPSKLMALSVVATLYFGLVFLLVFGSALAAIASSAGGSEVEAIEQLLAGGAGGIFTKGLMFAVLAAPMFMAVYFAPALIAINDLPLVHAMKLSLDGCLKNVMPFLVYFLILLGGAMLIAILAGLLGSVLGVFVSILVFPVMFCLVPITISASFHAYQSIFTEIP